MTLVRDPKMQLATFLVVSTEILVMYAKGCEAITQCCHCSLTEKHALGIKKLVNRVKALQMALTLA